MKKFKYVKDIKLSNELKTLYVKDEYVNSSKRIKTFLKRYFEKYQPETYYDSKFKKIQCLLNKRRSLYDLFILTKTKFKTATFEKVCFAVGELCLKRKIFGVYCNGVKAFVFNNPKLKGNYLTGNNIFTKYTIDNYSQMKCSLTNVKLKDLNNEFTHIKYNN